ncbi:NDP-sugar synthase [Marinobacter salinisoli]|uniref:NDP-sugar synthase n=1 Tax=Marinobacter salinisoli TaxID=2769486 RepID=A0ABX7MNW7_9GAMM|nr:NDP-sugar synthase [Marinobacter salinisoli]QSP93981.1 NDP-sugar synthase [Marinobacter salinisoli]
MATSVEQKSVHQALVFADRTGEELAPVNELYCPAMLPVGGIPVLEHTLVQLQGAGITEVFLVVPTGDTHIRSYFEDGARWSLQLYYLVASTADTPDRVRARLGRNLAEPFAALRGDVWRKELSAPEENCAPYCTLSNAKTTRFELWNVRSNSINALCWSAASDAPMSGAKTDDDFSELGSLREYHRIATATANVSAGQSGEAGSRGLQVGALSKAHAVSLRDGRTLVGDSCQLEAGVELSGNNAIGNGCVIARGASIKNSVILDHTYIGHGMRLENAIVVKQRVIRVDIGATLDVQDSFFLASSQFDLGQGFFGRMVERFIALALIPLSVLCRFFPQSSDRVLARQHTPKLLWHVVAGRLRLFGRPQSAPIADQLAKEGLPWSVEYQRLETGAFSPAELHYRGSEDANLLSLAEIELAQIRFSRKLAMSLLDMASDTFKLSQHKATSGAHYHHPE